MPQLNKTTAPRSLQIGASAPTQTGIVHIGLAQFHRAHAAVATAQALAVEPGPWGIVGVAPRSEHVVDALRRQDFLYSLLELSPAGTSVGIVDVHRDAIVAAHEPQRVLEAIAAPEHKIVTLTITENGYHFDAADIQSGQRPTSMIALLARGLELRHKQNAAPISVLSCDNIQSAGTLTRTLILDFLQRCGASPATIDWVNTHVTFPNSMVDRIVPGTTETTRTKVREIAGYDDAIPVPCETFTMWVIEDNFAAGRPAWEHAEGVIFSDEVERYEQVKLRLLNGSHSLLSYLGALDQRETIPDARTQPWIQRCVHQAINNEFLPSIELPTGFDAPRYIESLFTRWTNFALGDAIARVGSDGSAKLLQRVPKPAQRLLDQGIVPQQMALLVAAWIACVCPPTGFTPGPIADAMAEPQRDRMAALTAHAETPQAHAAAILHSELFPTELSTHSAFVTRVGDLLQHIVEKGIEVAANEASDTAQKRTHNTLIFMGVCGSGKTTVAELFSQRYGYTLADADDFHTAENVAKMNSGTPLTDEDREPWLRNLAAWLAQQAATGTPIVLTCSALKKSYRDILRSSGVPLTFVHLTGTRALLAERMAGRKGHFMPASLLDSQLAILQPLEGDETGIDIDIADSPAQLAARIGGTLGIKEFKK